MGNVKIGIMDKFQIARRIEVLIDVPLRPERMRSLAVSKRIASLPDRDPDGSMAKAEKVDGILRT